MHENKQSAKALLCTLACAWSCMAASASPSPEQIALRSSTAIELQRKAIMGFPWREVSQVSSLLENKQFERLEAILKRYLIEWKDAPDKEGSQLLLLETIDASNPNLLYLLNEWITQSPSAIAFLARGSYLNRRGQLLRGRAPTNATPALNLALLSAVHLRASIDLQQAIKLNPSLLPAYTHLLEVAKFSPRLNIDTEKLLANATRYHPLTFEARRRYLDSLSPAWGGSFDAMERFAQSLSSPAEANPLLWTLRAHVHYEKAAALPRSEARQKIVELTAALKFADFNKYYEARALAHQALNQNGEAIADLERCALSEKEFLRGQIEPQSNCKTYLATTKASAQSIQRAEDKNMQGEKQ